MLGAFYLKTKAFLILRKGVLLFKKIGFCNGKAPSDMEGRGVERKIKGVLFFKNSLHYIVIS